jgi:uncharacterized protein (DUF1697 family)
MISVAIRLESGTLQAAKLARPTPQHAKTARTGDPARRHFRVHSSYNHWPMALVVFLRGINVGGHRRLRPSALAKALSDYGVVNVGAAGTFVVRKPGSRTKFRAALMRKLPFEAQVVLCDGRDLISLEMENPFGTVSLRPDMVRFVSILAKAGRVRTSIPFTVPASGKWFVRVIASKSRFVFGVYRRHMKTIGYLGQIDKLFGAPATTRNWNTIVAIVRILKAQGKTGQRN